MQNYVTEFMPFWQDYNQNTEYTDITDKVFDDKLSQMQRKLSLIQDKLEQRKQIKDLNLTDILEDECTVENLILAQPDVFTPYQPPSKQTVQLEEFKLKLNEKKRMELANAWRDVSRLYSMGIDAYVDLMRQNSEKELMDNL